MINNWDGYLIGPGHRGSASPVVYVCVQHHGRALCTSQNLLHHGVNTWYCCLPCCRINSSQAYLASPLTYNNGQGCLTPCAKPDSDSHGCCDGVWLPTLNFMNTFGLSQVRTAQQPVTMRKLCIVHVSSCSNQQLTASSPA